MKSMKIHRSVTTMAKDTQAELRKAVGLLGGPRRAERLSGISRSVLSYWMHISIPEWRLAQAQMVVELAADTKKRVSPFGETPQWAIERLKERRKRASTA